MGGCRGGSRASACDCVPSLGMRIVCACIHGLGPLRARPAELHPPPPEAAAALGPRDGRGHGGPQRMDDHRGLEHPGLPYTVPRCVLRVACARLSLALWVPCIAHPSTTCSAFDVDYLFSLAPLIVTPNRLSLPPPSLTLPSALWELMDVRLVCVVWCGARAHIKGQDTHSFLT